MISFIIPYKNNPERFSLLEATVKNIPVREDVQFCFVEILPTQCLSTQTDYQDRCGHPWLLDCINGKTYQTIWQSILYFWQGTLSRKIKYMSLFYDGIFHRALAINYGVRNLTNDGDKIVIWEGDIVIPHIAEMIDDINNCQHPSSGFNAIYHMDKQETNHFLKTNEYPTFHRMHALGFSHANGQAGGITIIDRKLFMELKGIPEMFEGTWGNDDNAFWYKLNAFGYAFRNMGRVAYHLYHEHRTERDEKIRKQILEIAEWNSADWQEYNEKIGDDWGKNK